MCGTYEHRPCLSLSRRQPTTRNQCAPRSQHVRAGHTKNYSIHHPMHHPMNHCLGDFAEAPPALMPDDDRWAQLTRHIQPGRHDHPNETLLLLQHQVMQRQLTLVRDQTCQTSWSFHQRQPSGEGKSDGVASRNARLHHHQSRFARFGVRTS